VCVFLFQDTQTADTHSMAHPTEGADETTPLTGRAGPPPRQSGVWHRRLCAAGRCVWAFASSVYRAVVRVLGGGPRRLPHDPASASATTPASASASAFACAFASASDPAPDSAPVRATSDQWRSFATRLRNRTASAQTVRVVLAAAEVARAATEAWGLLARRAPALARAATRARLAASELLTHGNKKRLASEMHRRAAAVAHVPGGALDPSTQRYRDLDKLAQILKLVLPLTNTMRARLDGMSPSGVYLRDWMQSHGENMTTTLEPAQLAIVERVVEKAAAVGKTSEQACAEAAAALTGSTAVLHDRGVKNVRVRQVGRPHGPEPTPPHQPLTTLTRSRVCAVQHDPVRRRSGGRAAALRALRQLRGLPRAAREGLRALRWLPRLRVVQPRVPRRP